MKALCVAACVWAVAGQGFAASVDEIALNELVFDNLAITPGTGTDVSLSGVSGIQGAPVSWSIPLAFGPLTDSTTLVSFNFLDALPAQSFEHVHVGGFTINFDAPISSLLIYAQNDNGGSGAGFDLGILPTDSGGATTAAGATGFLVNTSLRASYFLYEFPEPVTTVTAATLSETDGFDLSFFPDPFPAPVPLPLNGQVAGELVAGATDAFTVILSEAGTLTVTSESALDLSASLLLDGQVVASDDDGGADANFSVTQLLEAPGEYRLEVSGFDESVAGAYTLTTSFTASAAEPDCPTIIDDDGNLWDSTILTCDEAVIAADEAQLFRSYSGAFNRIPDIGGYNWWLNEIREGRHNLGTMLAGFLFSAEFLALVNAPDGNSIDNAVLINHIYQNVFGRLPDPGGFAFWFGELESGRRTQARVLEEMTQSNEFVEKKLLETVEFVAPLTPSS